MEKDQTQEHRIYGPYISIDRWGNVRIRIIQKSPKIHPLRKEFAVLGLVPGSKAKKVKQRYRELAFKNHPDKGGDQGKMVKINLAYKKIISFLNKRR